MYRWKGHFTKINLYKETMHQKSFLGNLTSENKKKKCKKKFCKQGHILHRQNGNFTTKYLSKETMDQNSIIEPFIAILRQHQC